MRKTKFANGEYYHIYNRGTDKRDVFLDEYDYARFLRSLEEFNRIEPIGSLYIKDQLSERGVAAGPLQEERLVEIIAFCLNPNHFHLILKQEKEGGVSEFMKRVSGGYTGHFNFRYKRTGVLFQGKFKAIHIDSNEYLLYLSAYVNGNNLVHDTKTFRSSLGNYLKNKKDNLCNPEIILSQFQNREGYKDFVANNAVAIKEKREGIKQYLLEE